jgi:hypothetical protein
MLASLDYLIRNINNEKLSLITKGHAAVARRGIHSYHGFWITIPPTLSRVLSLPPQLQTAMAALHYCVGLTLPTLGVYQIIPLGTTHISIDFERKNIQTDNTDNTDNSFYSGFREKSLLTKFKVNNCLEKTEYIVFSKKYLFNKKDVY